MGQTTKIEWCDHTWNPWRGCTKVSPGCANCYAERLAKRRPSVFGEWGPNGKRVIAAEPYWRLPKRWNRLAEAIGQPRRVFVGSLMDVFEDRPELIKPRKRLFDLIYECPWLDWLTLTKRPEFAYEWIGGKSGAGWGVFAGDFPHVSIGVSIENQRALDHRLSWLLKMPIRKRFLSLEPLLGPIEHLPLDGIGWVIVGGESGPGARPCDLKWIHLIRRQCRDAEVPLFLKQVGANPVGAHVAPGVRPEVSIVANGSFKLKHPKGGDWTEWPEELRVREFPES